jgi:response regulator RpfG family c-di-GMP phosphodiesterase
MNKSRLDPLDFVHAPSVGYDRRSVASHQTAQRDPSEQLARRWVSEGRITRELAQAALQHRSVTGQRLEEALLDVGIREDQLLRLLAETYRCQYISTEKLGTATVNKAILGLVPRRIAEQRLVVPVLLDRQQSVLSVVMASPDDRETLKQLEVATQVKVVRPLVARPAAVKAAVAKFYDGDDFAFSALRGSAMDRTAGIDTNVALGGARSPGNPGLLGPTLDLESAESHSQVLPNPVAGARAAVPDAMLPRAAAPGPEHLPDPPRGGMPARARRRLVQAEPIELEDDLDEPSRGPADSVDDVAELDSFPPARRPPASPQRRPAARREEHPRVAGPRGKTTDRQTAPGAKLEAVGDPFQLAVVLVSLLEGNRQNLRGHSIQTARLVRKLCDEFRVPDRQARAAEIASLIHDVGKASGSYHLTAYNVAQFDGHRTAARKLCETPERVLESAKLAKATIQTVHHMYERYDGKGFPNGLKENDIPLESRILALCDSYVDLTSNPRNSFRKVLSPQEACEALREMQGSVFDPKVVARFTRAVLGADLAQQLRSDHGTILLVDPDVENTTMLELALQEKLYDVHVVRSEEEAIQFTEAAKSIDVIVSEMDLPKGNGLLLLEQLRKLPGGERAVFVFLAADGDSTKVAQALEAGAADYLFKPIESQIVVAKVRHLLERSQRRKESQEGRGVSGSLEEMALPDIVQVLHQGRKSGAVGVRSEGQSGAVYFEDGAIVDCTCGTTRGDQAFYDLVGISKGAFTIDPKARTDERTIQVSAEMLLLEGMRRLDEASR